MQMVRARGPIGPATPFTVMGQAGAPKKPLASRAMEEYRRQKQERLQRMYAKAGITRD